MKTDHSSFNQSRELENELRSSTQGEVRFDNGSRALYATDASNYRQVPIGVVIPKDIEDVIHAVKTCHHYRVPILARGGGTSLAGQCCNVAVVIDMSKHVNKIVELDPHKRLARVEPGVILDNLRDAAEKHGLTFGPDPATHDRCTLGGMIGNNSCGVHSIMVGRTVDNVEELEILTYDGLRMRVGATRPQDIERIIQEGGRKGEIYRKLKALRDRYENLIRTRYPNIPRRVSGYNLDELLSERGFQVARALVGTEGTCVMVLSATLRLVPSFPARSLLVLGFSDIYQAADRVMDILKHKPIGLEAIDDRLVKYMRKKEMHSENVKLLPDGDAWLLIEFGGESKSEANDRAHRLADEITRGKGQIASKLFDNPLEQRMIWAVRESGLGAAARVPGEKDAWAGWEDSAVAPEKVAAYLRDLRKLYDKYGYDGALYGHFGQGCIHSRISFDLITQGGVTNYRSFINEATDLVVRYDGSLSGEHGDGQSRAEFLPKMFGNELVQAFCEFKTIWDPDGKMNPGKVVDPYRIDENLRLGADYKPWQPETHFQFPHDDGSLARATLRCVGVGKCRRESGGTMCPSYMVTREEKHSTRGRAHLLFEMMQGDIIKQDWREEHVKEALDLCLACKGCKSDCPVNVDIATYKAEFLSHYYKGRIRPAAAYTMGLIHWWASLASYMPGVANFLAQTPALGDLLKKAIGIAPERRIPVFAHQSFKQWFKGRPLSNEKKPQVILWPDTFSNYFQPNIAVAAVHVLESLGYQVLIPKGSLCCGRPLYDYGMLNLAKKLLSQILSCLEPFLLAEIPVVGLEPSCISVFRDELLNLFPENEVAKRLSQQSFLLSEFLEKKVRHYQIPKLNRKALVQGHCHHKAIVGMREEENVFRKLDLDYTILDSGCCGMAGSFGFEKDHYAISVKAGERVLLPSVREASPDTLIVADGFSCREQIAQLTDRHALHLAEVIDLAIRGE